MVAASDNEFPKIILVEGSAPATPDSGEVKVYAKTDGLVYSKDDAGTETGPFGPGGGGVTVEDEGTPLSTTATSLDFVGAGVTASGTGATKTITIPGGGGGGSPAYLGYNTVGGTEQVAVFLRWYTKKITTTAAAMLYSVEVYIKEAADSVQDLHVALFDDNAGARGDTIATGVSDALVLSSNPSMVSNYRWEGVAITRALAASTSYWIGWMYAKPLGGGPDVRHKYDTGGSDRIFDSANVYVSDGGFATETDTTFTYSARALIL